MRDRSIFPIVQLEFKKYEASDFWVALLFSSIPLAIGMISGPFISFMSDRHRGPRGRRIPYLIATTPAIVVAIAGLAFSPKLGGWIHGAVGTDWGLSLPQTILIVLGVFLVCFEFASGVANMIFGGLVNDVVPQAVLGRFFAMFRIVSLLVGVLFNYYILGEAETNPTAIFLGVAALYGVGLTLVCMKVKEGDYPPPPALSTLPRARRFVEAVKTYFRDGYSKSYYRWYFAAIILAQLAVVPANLYNLFLAKSLGMTTAEYGKCLSYSFMVSLCLTYPLGVLADRLHPLRMTIIALVCYAAVMITGAFVAVDGKSFGTILIVQSVIAGFYYTVSFSVPQRLLPWNNFASVASAGGTINCVVGILFAPALGIFLDRSGNSYRYIFMIGGVIAMLAVAVNLVLFAKFKRLGGPKNYVAP